MNARASYLRHGPLTSFLTVFRLITYFSESTLVFCAAVHSTFSCVLSLACVLSPVPLTFRPLQCSPACPRPSSSPTFRRPCPRVRTPRRPPASVACAPRCLSFSLVRSQFDPLSPFRVSEFPSLLIRLTSPLSTLSPPLGTTLSNARSINP